MTSIHFSFLAAALLTVSSFAAPDEQKSPAQAPAATPPAKPLPTYADAMAAQHVGEEAIITGKVVAIGKSQQGNSYLNFGDRFPKQTFSGVVRAKDAEKVGDVSKFEGKNVAITGKIELYNEKPQIVISAPEQIKMVDAPAPATPAATKP